MAYTSTPCITTYSEIDITKVKALEAVKAELLLRKFLDKRQLKQYRDHGKIIVKGQSGINYMVPKRSGERSPGGLENTILGFEGQEVVSIWCVGLPMRDGTDEMNLLAIKLMLENDELSIRAIANNGRLLTKQELGS
jgi:hypothetical protein